MKFTELNLNDKLKKGIEAAGFTTLMQVQEETLVHTLKGRDAYVQSQTGTGKTAAFLITIFHSFLEKNDPRKKKRALIVAPTRELAIQIEKEAKILGLHLDFKIGCFYGGVGYNIQERLLKEGVDIIVGTPGRLLDFHQKRKLDFNRINILVIDEADRMFDMGFLPDIRRILDRVSRGSVGQVMLFSATLDTTTRAIAREYMKNPVKIEIMPEQITVDKITQILYHVGEQEKMKLMLGILKKELPRNALIFTNMKHEADRVARHLEHNGYKCQHISGDLPQSKRLRVINHFKSGKLPFLVATDVAARGLHIDDLELIINYDLPGDCENYVHRIGRTARAGKSGKAISLVCEKYVYNLEAIENFIGMKIPVAFAEDNLYLEDKAEGMKIGKSMRSRRSGRGKKALGKHASRSKPGYRKPSAKDKTTPTTKKHAKEESKKRPHKEPANFRHPSKKKTKRSQKTATLEDRLEYYKKKYGENFNIKKTTEIPGKPSLIKKISGFFKKKK
ncbi:MAG: DEAD/DEAH box helicase [Candidatus Aminicenantes bacterium]|jgi:ATP-dependent RNA helicase RhlB